MKLSLTRRAPQRMRHRLGAYGMTAALGLFTAGGLVPQCAPPPPPPPANAVADVQDTAVTLTNQHRAAAGLAPVYVDARLTRAAQDHSNYMAQNRLMTHTGAGGTNPGQRISATGYRFWTWAENVAAGQRSAEEVVTAWMNSSGHRKNILNGNMAHIGVAAAQGSDGVIYWTMVLANGG